VASVAIPGESFQSRLLGVAHVAKLAASTSVWPAWIPVGGILRRVAVLLRLLLASPTVAVGQLASSAKSSRLLPCRVSPIALFTCPPWFPSLLCAVGHEPQSLPDVRCADARSRQTDRPDGVAFSFQVIANQIEPSVINRCFNLLTKDDVRAALADEAKPRRPKVARIVGAGLLART